MKFIVVIAALTAFAVAKDVPFNPAEGYLQKYGIPKAEQIRKAEEEYLNNSERIAGGLPAALGQRPYQAGLLGDIIGLASRSVCGASLLTRNRLVTAAHCWSDGVHQVWRFTVVLGSVFLFRGGTRIQTSNVVMHPNWSHLLIRNDVAVIKLPTQVTFSANIAPIALPSGSELNKSFAGATAFASGFGLTGDGHTIGDNQYKSHVRLNVISNSLCRTLLLFIPQDSNICTSGIGGVGPCPGDSGGALVTFGNYRDILIGVTSFGTVFGCEAGIPAVFARVTSFVSFINQNL